MKIPQKFPQFERFPGLFVASGEYEARFYLAYDSHIELIEILKKTPRDEAGEKQAFVGKKSGMFDPVAVSHRGAYREDLKRKFFRSVHGIFSSILALHSNIEGIYLFVPRYVGARLTGQLAPAEKEKIRMIFYGEYIKESPLCLIEIFSDEAEKIKHVLPLSRENSTLIPLISNTH